MDLIDRIDRLLIDESTVVGGSYIAGTTSVTGSGQTRAGFEELNLIPTMQQKEPGNVKPVKFNTLLGGYVPSEKQPDDVPLYWSMRN